MSHFKSEAHSYISSAWTCLDRVPRSNSANIVNDVSQAEPDKGSLSFTSYIVYFRHRTGVDIAASAVIGSSYTDATRICHLLPHLQSRTVCISSPGSGRSCHPPWKSSRAVKTISKVMEET